MAFVIVGLCAPVAVSAQTVPVPVGGPPITGVSGGGSGSVPPPVSTIAPVQAGPTVVTTTIAPPPPLSPPASTSPVGETVPGAGPVTAPVITPVPITSLARGASGATTTSTVPSATSPEELRRQIIGALASAGGDRSASVVVDGEVVVDLGSGSPRPPASTQKMFTAGAALLLLGADHRFVTNVKAAGSVSGGTLTGDLVLVASGDPSFTSSHLADLAAQVVAAGIRNVSGRLLVDDSHFDRIMANPGWKSAFVPGEVGPLSAFIVDGNHRSDRATLSDPALANLNRFRAALTAAGVAVVGPNDRGVLADTQVVATRASVPLSDLVVHMMKRSDNTYAEAILKELGTISASGSSVDGAAEVTRQFDRFGVPRPVLADGSGLSVLDRSTAMTQAQWLMRLDALKLAPLFRSSFPIACVDGTLKNRLCGTAAAGNVVAKTGSLDKVVTLAGYATTASGRRAVFSILLSRVPSEARARAAMDRAVVALAAYRG